MSIKIRRNSVACRNLDQCMEEQVETWIGNFVAERGLKAIGDGAFATVYSKGKTGRVVYKIGKVDLECYINGRPRSVCAAYRYDPYIVYLEDVVLKHQGNPFIPKVYDVQYIHFHDKWGERAYLYVVKMERLNKYVSIHKIRKRLLAKFGMDRVSDIADDAANVALYDTTGQFRKVAKSFIALFRKHSEDLHTGNVMWRGRGIQAQLVITDPVA